MALSSPRKATRSWRDRPRPLPAGELVKLEENRLAGHWKKMEDNRTTGDPTPGMKPIGRTRDTWKNIYQFKRGDLVSIKRACDP